MSSRRRPYRWQRLLTPGGFLLVGCCFLLPFVTVSCVMHDPANGTVTETYRGTTLVVGGHPGVAAHASVPPDRQPSPPDVVPSPEDVDRSLTADVDRSLTAEAARAETESDLSTQPLLGIAVVLALAAAIGALVYGGRHRERYAAIVAVCAAVLLSVGEWLALRAARTRAMDELVMAQGGTPSTTGDEVTVHARPAWGFVVAMVILAVLAAVNGFRGWRGRRRASEDAGDS